MSQSKKPYRYANASPSTEIRMLCWIRGQTRQYRIKNECRDKNVVLEVLVRRVNQIKAIPIPRGRGRLRKTIGKVIKKDLEINILSMNMIYNRVLWYRLIHVTDPT
ncbi:hypothetical protein Lal_00001931 [Lupinus albus]|nr:hypothetical protein Lal_00001931 [Lupinus albus]